MICTYLRNKHTQPTKLKSILSLSATRRPAPSLAPSPNMWHVVIELVLACPVRPRNKWVAKSNRWGHVTVQLRRTQNENLHFRVSSLVAVSSWRVSVTSTVLVYVHANFHFFSSLQLLPTNAGCRKMFGECLAIVAFAVAMKKFQCSPAT